MTPTLLALSLITQLHCSSVNGINIWAQINHINEQNFEVRLKNDYIEMPVHQKRIAYDHLGEIEEVETSAWWETFHVQKAETNWNGEYWYDNAYYPLRCSEQLTVNR